MGVRPIRAILVACVSAGLLLAATALPAAASVPATYVCTTNVTGPQTFKASIHAVPSASSYKPGAAVSLSGFQVVLTIPSSLVSLVESFGITSVSGVVTTFTVATTDAAPASLNVAGKGFAVPTTKLPKVPSSVSVKFPAQPATIKGWKAGTVPGTITFRTGQVVLTVSDNLGDTLPVICTPKPSALLASARVV